MLKDDSQVGQTKGSRKASTAHKLIMSTVFVMLIGLICDALINVQIDTGAGNSFEALMQLLFSIPAAIYILEYRLSLR